MLCHIFNPDILFAIVSCGSHVDIGVLVPPVLAFESEGLSLSRLMTVFTKAVSIADILLLYNAAEMLRAADHRSTPQSGWVLEGWRKEGSSPCMMTSYHPDCVQPLDRSTSHKYRKRTRKDVQTAARSAGPESRVLGPKHARLTWVRSEN